MRTNSEYDRDPLPVATSCREQRGLHLRFDNRRSLLQKTRNKLRYYKPNCVNSILVRGVKNDPDRRMENQKTDNRVGNKIMKPEH